MAAAELSPPLLPPGMCEVVVEEPDKISLKSGDEDLGWLRFAGSELLHIEITRPSARRNGYGNRLVEEFCSRQGLPITVTVPADNLQAFHLFKNFVPVPTAAAAASKTITLQIYGGNSPPPAVAEQLADFTNTFVALLSSVLRDLPVPTAALIFRIQQRAAQYLKYSPAALTAAEVETIFENFDLDRLDTFIAPGCHPSLVADVWPSIADIYFRGLLTAGRIIVDDQVHSLHLGPFQLGALLGVGLQHKTVETVALETGVLPDHIRVHLRLCLRKIRDYFSALIRSSSSPLPATEKH